MDVISIVPNDAGWQVESEALPAPLMFLSGGKAEEAAKRLARALAEQDRWVEIRVHMKGGDMLGRFVCPPANAEDRRPRRGASFELAAVAAE